MTDAKITEEEVLDLLGDLLGFIEDTELRQKVVDTWRDACDRGGWTSKEEVMEIPFTLLTDTRGITFMEHVIAVTKGAYGLARGQEEGYKALPYEIDYDRLIAGGLLHDVGKLTEFEKDESGGWRKSQNGRCTSHPIAGAVIAAQHGVPDEILNIIVCDAQEDEAGPQVIESVFIQQADTAAFNPCVMMELGTLIQ